MSQLTNVPISLLKRETGKNTQMGDRQLIDKSSESFSVTIAKSLMLEGLAM